ncbi:MAG: YeeE/YedE thiosulfate transporter family protein [Candidatus Sumerlaeia bacterium]
MQASHTILRKSGKHYGFMLLAVLVFLAMPDLIWGQEPAGNGLIEDNVFTRQRWSPYVCGIGIGILSWLAFLLSDHPLGVSTAYARTAGMIEKGLRGRKVLEKSYYQEYKPKIDWEWMLVIGLLVGAFLSAWLSGGFRWEMVPSLWEDTFGSSAILRWGVALLGGFLIGLGARWADGCTSGHGISGALQLVVSSWVALVCFFIGGVAAAFFIFHLVG